MFAESNKIKEGELVSFVVYKKWTKIRSRRVVGEVLKVNKVNMVIREDHEDMYKRKIWTVYKNYVRRYKENKNENMDNQ